MEGSLSKPSNLEILLQRSDLDLVCVVGTHTHKHTQEKKQKLFPLETLLLRVRIHHQLLWGKKNRARTFSNTTGSHYMRELKFQLESISNNAPLYRQLSHLPPAPIRLKE